MGEEPLFSGRRRAQQAVGRARLVKIQSRRGLRHAVGEDAPARPVFDLVHHPPAAASP